MAKLKALPSLEVIKTLKGTLDYYYWKGIPCVRSWPHIPMSSRTPASLASAQIFGQIASAWGVTGDEIKALYNQDAADQPRTGRDIYMSAAHGHLHEASMSDFLDLLTECRDSLALLQALINALGSIATDDLQVDVKTLPAPVHVEGEDQVFTLKGPLADSVNAELSGDDGWIASTPVGAGDYWIVTNIEARNGDTALTSIRLQHRHGVVLYGFGGETRAIAIGERWYWNHWLCADPEDQVRAYMYGGLAGDSCQLRLTGYIMTLAT